MIFERRRIKIPDLSTALELSIGTAHAVEKELGFHKVYERSGFPPERNIEACATIG
jgi:hypothetical protein